MSEEAVMDPPRTAQEMNAEYNEKTAARERRQGHMRHHAESAEVYRIAYINGKVGINYTIIENNKNNEFDFSSDDKPCEAFEDALRSLAPHVSKMLNRLEGEQTRQATQMTAKSVTFKYHKDGNIHASICITRQLDTGHCFTFNTPMMPLESSDPAVATLGKDVADILYALVDEAKAYIGGKRAQRTLDFPEQEDDVDPLNGEEWDDVIGEEDEAGEE